MNIQPYSQITSVHDPSISKKSHVSNNISQKQDVFTASPESKIKKILMDGDYDFHNISRGEMENLSDQLYKEGLISPLEQMLMNTPAKWEINGENVTGSALDEKIDYLSQWKQMTEIDKRSNRSAPVVYDLLERLQALT
ncbi:hypothetical protein [uncultured Desulfuromonas sp.]|uniref:hypothetical protein n=1 Tax=uncultured Desulfuromonas sp. TaxID=181013 RepID=UPI002AAB8166|nr:hypothetical protein [uncultured Desulfuromonas sp.]